MTAQQMKNGHWHTLTRRHTPAESCPAVLARLAGAIIHEVNGALAVALAQGHALAGAIPSHALPEAAWLLASMREQMQLAAQRIRELAVFDETAGLSRIVEIQPIVRDAVGIVARETSGRCRVVLQQVVQQHGAQQPAAEPLWVDVAPIKLMLALLALLWGAADAGARRIRVSVRQTPNALRARITVRWSPALPLGAGTREWIGRATGLSSGFVRILNTPQGIHAVRIELPLQPLDQDQGTH